MTPKRVVQWSTGNVGRRALSALLDRPDLELVGVYSHSPAKVGSDAGALAGRDAVTGVIATDDVDALTDVQPDCVCYTPHAIDYQLVAKLLRAGVNVVTTGDFLTGTRHPAERALLEQAARDGGVSFLGTGFEPGFLNVAAGFLTGACRRVHSLTIVENLDCTTYPVRDAWTVLGFGRRPPPQPTVIDPATQRYGLGYFETLDLVAAMLDVELEYVEGHVEHAVLTRDLDLGWVQFDAGTVGGQRRRYRGYRGGRSVTELAICWTMSPDALDPQWEHTEGFRIEIEGEPRVDASIRFTLPNDAAITDEDDVMGLLMVGTAMAAVNAIPFVCQAPPGLVTPIDLPVTGSRGALLP